MDISNISEEYYEDADYQDNKSEVRTAKSKVFQCTGYGDCDMVFTRSEHLARHMRKHTGEKPFQCIVPGCERMFSRYDNMMQHTQTHNKSRGTLRRTKTTSKKMRGNGKKATFHRGSSSDEYSDDFGPLPSPPPSRRGSSRDLSSALNSNASYNMLVDDDDDSGDDEYSPSAYYQRPLSPPPPPCIPPTSGFQQPFYHQQQPFRYEGWFPPSNINTTALPPSRCPDSPISSESSGSRSGLTELTKHRRRSTPHVYYHPYPYQHPEKQLVPILPRRSVLPQLACYLVNHPNALPESYFEKPKIHRRLSLQDLSNPIESLKDSSDAEEGIDLTEDEFQAIQGFGQFCRAAVTCTK